MEQRDKVIRRILDALDKLEKKAGEDAANAHLYWSYGYWKGVQKARETVLEAV